MMCYEVKEWRNGRMAFLDGTTQSSLVEGLLVGSQGPVPKRVTRHSSAVLTYTQAKLALAAGTV